MVELVDQIFQSVRIIQFPQFVFSQIFLKFFNTFAQLQHLFGMNFFLLFEAEVQVGSSSDDERSLLFQFAFES